ncbi:MAG: hypothetical protein J4G18_17895 [Anaerolineae bacterium]|nr:hypothetical protein [Anaerolineae bacterium]
MMGCLIFLILAFIFRGAIIALLGWVLSAFIALLTLLLSAGIWGLIILVVLCAIVAAFA